MISDRASALLQASATIYASESLYGAPNTKECVDAAHALLALIEAREKQSYPARKEDDGA